MEITNLRALRGEHCPHVLAFVKDASGEVAIGCPTCGYVLPLETTIYELTAPTAEYTTGTVSSYLAAANSAKVKAN